MNTGASNVVTPPESIDLSLMDPILQSMGAIAAR